MNQIFSETIRRLRTESGLSQTQLAEKMYISRSTVAKWESGDRMPDAIMISRLAKCLGVNIDAFFSQLSDQKDTTNIIMVDDETIILTGGLAILEEVFPTANISGFTRPSEAISYAQQNPVSLAFLDVEMGKHNGLELCGELQRINPRTNVIIVTAYMDYSLKAWKTGAAGYILKPITAEEIRDQLPRLRYPIGGMKLND